MHLTEKGSVLLYSANANAKDKDNTTSASDDRDGAYRLAEMLQNPIVGTGSCGTGTGTGNNSTDTEIDTEVEDEGDRSARQHFNCRFRLPTDMPNHHRPQPGSTAGTTGTSNANCANDMQSLEHRITHPITVQSCVLTDLSTFNSINKDDDKRLLAAEDALSVVQVGPSLSLSLS